MERVALRARAVRLVLGWCSSGQASPHPFFNRTDGGPLYPVEVLSVHERGLAAHSPAVEGLRAAGGPA